MVGVLEEAHFRLNEKTERDAENKKKSLKQDISQAKNFQHHIYVRKVLA